MPNSWYPSFFQDEVMFCAPGHMLFLLRISMGSLNLSAVALRGFLKHTAAAN